MDAVKIIYRIFLISRSLLHFVRINYGCLHSVKAKIKCEIDIFIILKVTEASSRRAPFTEVLNIYPGMPWSVYSGIHRILSELLKDLSFKAPYYGCFSRNAVTYNTERLPSAYCVYPPSF